jgi:hypothetical protein
MDTGPAEVRWTRSRPAGNGAGGPTGRSTSTSSFNPAIRDEAAKRIRAQIRRWRLHQRSGSSLADLAREVKPIVRGWINYYGRFYPSALVPSLKGIDQYLMRWATQKYKRLRRRRSRAWQGLESTAKLYPGLCAHWRILRPRTTG